MERNINFCFYAKSDFCPAGFAFKHCNECPKLKFCCAHVHNCEPWHCSIYIDFKDNSRRQN